MRVFTIYYYLFVLVIAAIAIFMLPGKYRRADDVKSATIAKVCGYVYAILATALFIIDKF